MESGLLIDRLISSIENSTDINQIDKLKIVKVLLAIKIKLIEFSDKDMFRPIKTADKPPHSYMSSGGKVPAKSNNGHDRARSSGKHNLVLRFIKDKGGRVNAMQLLELGLAGRSLRRYIKVLCRENKIKIEKSGRNYFYLIA
ncbi:MAG: hypothetical protein HY451_00585 [Parcubacteria group bacterium]|nr:hypothetical protein [Parcubacteria group bacterium]